MSSHPSHDGGSPRQPNYALRVFRIDAGKRVYVRLTANRYGGLLTHWKDKRGHYCTGADCPAALHKLNSFWKGYGAAEAWEESLNSWLPICLELTEHLELDFRDKWQRGGVWEISRGPKTGSKHAVTEATFVKQLDPASLPEPVNILPTLHHVYHVQPIKLDVKNPLPPRTLVMPSPGEPPVAGLSQIADGESQAKEFEKIKALLASRATRWKMG